MMMITMINSPQFNGDDDGTIAAILSLSHPSLLDVTNVEVHSHWLKNRSIFYSILKGSKLTNESKISGARRFCSYYLT